jgi:hypothetical protein
LVQFGKIVSLLNEVDKISKYFGLCGAPIKCNRRDKAFIYLSIILFLLYAYFYTLASLEGNTLGRTLYTLYEEGGCGWKECFEVLYQNVTKPSAYQGINTYSMFMNLENSTTLERVPVPLVAIFGVFVNYTNFLQSCFWNLTFCGLFLCCVLFSKLFEAFHAKIKARKYFEMDVLEVKIE